MVIFNQLHYNAFLFNEQLTISTKILTFYIYYGKVETMPKERNEHKEDKHSEPKLSEIEKIVTSFRDAHGHDKLMNSIKSIIGNNDSQQKKSEKKEPAKKNLEHTVYTDTKQEPHKTTKVSSKDVAKDIRNGIVKYFRFNSVVDSSANFDCFFNIFRNTLPLNKFQ